MESVKLDDSLYINSSNIRWINLHFWTDLTSLHGMLWSAIIINRSVALLQLHRACMSMKKLNQDLLLRKLSTPRGVICEAWVLGAASPQDAPQTTACACPRSAIGVPSTFRWPLKWARLPYNIFLVTCSARHKSSASNWLIKHWSYLPPPTKCIWLFARTSYQAMNLFSLGSKLKIKSCFCLD